MDFLLREGSMQQRALHSRAPVRVIGGGFGNGKTTTAVQLALKLAKLYPGSNGLIARETLPKLNDTVRKEFLKWCPKSWIASFPMSQNSSNTCTLINGSMINFRYIAQQGKKEESSTSNLLSATYDWVIIDQIEDPGITHKDWLDIFGRLRGSTPGDFDPSGYDDLIGDYGTLPRSGPRWLIVTCNPTRNWFYKEVIEPLQTYRRTGRFNDKLLCRRDPKDYSKPLRDEQGHIYLMVDLFEGSTYENLHVYKQTGATDFLEKLESTYSGQMRKRFLLGEWAAYEGLVYPDYSDLIHGVSEEAIRDYLDALANAGVTPQYIEGYDYGQAKPACYLLAIADHAGNVVLCDGYYEAGLLVGTQAAKIREIRRKWMAPGANLRGYADPDIFRKKHASANTVGDAISDMFFAEGIMFHRGNNNIANGILKVTSYLAPRRTHRNPFNGNYPAPYLYVSNALSFVDREFGAYMWRKDRSGQPMDEPVDTDDHAMDALKYLLSEKPRLADVHDAPKDNALPAFMTSWGESPDRGRGGRRHG